MTLPNGSYSVRANVLLDCRADSTFIREDIDETSQLEGAHNPLKMQNAFLYSGQIESKLISFKTLSNHHPRKIEISKAWSIPKLSTADTIYSTPELQKRYNHLQGIHKL